MRLFIINALTVHRDRMTPLSCRGMHEELLFCWLASNSYKLCFIYIVYKYMYICIGLYLCLLAAKHNVSYCFLVRSC